MNPSQGSSPVAIHGVSGITPATVFVVDDDESVQRSLSRLIRSAGWNVATMGSAAEFLEHVDDPELGCVVMDVQMPGMTGPQLHAQLVARAAPVPVVFVTGHGDVPTGVEAMKRGAVDFLLKPVDDAALLEAIRRGLERHATEGAAQRQRQRIRARLALLSPRECQVLKFVIGGHMNKQIADRMAISLKTVKAHRARVMQKMQAASLAELVHACELAGMAFEPRTGAHPG